MRKTVLPHYHPFIAVLLATVLVSALFFEAFHANHDSTHCHEENCPICMVMQIVRASMQFFEPFGAVQKNVVLAFASLLCIISSLYIVSVTLVTQKTKLTI